MVVNPAVDYHRQNCILSVQCAMLSGYEQMYLETKSEETNRPNSAEPIAIELPGNPKQHVYQLC